MMRRSGRRARDRLRPVSLTPGYLDFAEGSCLITWGRTRVICAATVIETVPPFRQAKGGGWVTGEYAMLPRATHPRQERESRQGRVGGRTLEISASSAGRSGPWWTCRPWDPAPSSWTATSSRPTAAPAPPASPGPSWPCAWPWKGCGARTCWRPCPFPSQVAAVSVGAYRGQLLLDLDYDEDSQAAVDANFVGTGQGELIEVQFSGEEGPFPAAQLPQLLALAQEGLKELFHLQEEALRPWMPLSW